MAENVEGVGGEILSKEKESKFKEFMGEHLFFLIRLFFSIVLTVLALTLQVGEIARIVLFAAAALVIGYPLLIGAAKNIIRLDFFDENFLMVIASVVAFVIGEYLEGALIVILFNVGEFLEDIASDGSREKIAGLAKYKSESVHIYKDGNIETVSPESVKIGTTVLVKKGERIPIDGVLLSDNAELDVKVVTGESKLSIVKKGDAVYGGSINVGDAVTIETTKMYKDSTVERIIALVEESAERKSKSQRFITKFAKIYTPIVIALALLIAVVPPLFDQMEFAKWIYKSLSFLIVACPCALVISVPLCFFLGIGTLAKNGVLVKGGNYLEALAKTNVVVFDKTGTLTKGNFVVSAVLPENGYDKNELLKIASMLESRSTHPIARAIADSFVVDNKEVSDIKEIAGQGVYGKIDGKTYFIGRADVMEDDETAVVVRCEDTRIGIIKLSDEIKAESRSLVKELDKCGIKRAVMISGDSESVVKRTAGEIGIKEAYYKMMPQDKVDKLSEIISGNKKGAVAFCGDGVNDSPSIAIADIGVAMGALGSESAIENADVVISDDDLLKIPYSVKKAKKIRRTATVNIIGSIAVKVAIMALSVFIGIPLWVAMVGDVGVMLLAVLNSLTIGLGK